MDSPQAAGTGSDFHDAFVAGATAPGRLWAALALALVVLGLEIGGGLLSGSLALLSDATHVGVDIVALLVGLVAARLAARAPDSAHTYGYHRMEAIGALANAALLVAASAVILVESIGRLLAPSAVEAPVVLAVALIALVTNTMSALLIHGVRHQTIATRVLVLHLAGDAAGALAVIASALFILVGGSPIADAVASLVIALLLAIAGLRLLGGIVHLLVEGVPPSVSLADIAARLHTVPGVRAVHDLHAWALAEDLPMVTAHILVTPGADTRPVLLGATTALRQIGIGHSTLQLESDPCGQGRTVPPGERPPSAPAARPNGRAHPRP